MSKTVRRLLTVLVSVVVLVALLAGYLNFILVPQAAQQSLPQTSGELKLAGLNGPVDVYRDQMGIPHLYAATLHDLFMAQGFIHAQDRFWQMDFWRHIGSGRLAEMFGKGQLETDAFLRTLGWRQVAEQEWQSLDPESKSILEAYTEGVNAYLQDRTGTQLSLEYGVLGLLTPSYKPEPWTPVHSLTWAKAMAWDLRGNMGEEIERAILLKTLSPAQVAELFPPYPLDHPVVVPKIGEFASNGELGIRNYATSNPDSQFAIPNSQLVQIDARLASLDSVLGPSSPAIGSNNWAVSGKLTSTGMPLLANDPHLGIQMPSIWYQIGMHCQPRTDACPYEVGGFSFAGVPGVVIGHNDQIAWAFTNVGPDVMDLFVEKINPDNPNQYEYMGKWVDMDVRTEMLLVGGGQPVELTVRVTKHGPIISDTYGPLKNIVTPTAIPFKDRAGIDLPEHYTIALAWTALQPGNVFQAIWGFDKAQNWEQFRQAARGFVVPAQNLMYADVQGNIGYQMPGRIPIRQGGDGSLPVPGWTGEYEWTGYIPFEELPYVFNPPEGYIVSANNQVPPRDYPYLVGSNWDYGYRAQRIVDMIKQAPGKIDIAYIQKMQGDDKSLNAETLVPILLKVSLPADLAKIRDQYLASWDLQETMDSPSAALFEAFWWDLVDKTFTDENIPEDYWPAGGSRSYEIMRNLVQQPNSAWWDDKTTADKVETRDDIFAAAFAGAVKCKECTQKFGSDISKWKWGGLHFAIFRNQTLGKSGVSLIENLFNRGPYPTAGGESIVNATGWDIYKSFEVNWLPSMRMIVDLGDLNNSVTVHTTGESGHTASPHYADMVDLWRNIQYYPMWWNADAVQKDAEAYLQLKP